MNHALVTRIFQANILCFALILPILLGLTLGEESRLLRLGISALFLVVIFLLPALNATAILAKASGKTVDTAEFFAITTALVFLLPTFLLSIEADVFHILSPELPIVNSLVSFVLFVFFFSSRKEDPTQKTLPLAFPQAETFPVRTAFVTSLFIVVATITSIITAYYPLPDLDPYYWIGVFQDQFAKGIISSIASYRPLFSSLTYLFNQSAGVDLYAFFKYLIPFFALAPLVPAILVARRFSGFFPQIVIFLIPIVNASFFLYSTHPIPQSALNSLVVTAVFFTLHSLLSDKKEYFLFAGAILFIGFFYHEMAAIPFLLWLFSWLFFERKTLLRLAVRNRTVTVLIFLLLVSNISLFTPLLSFTSSWSKTVIHLLSVTQPNFAFPAQYINVDGNSAGWQGLTGVTQYYAYYFGPSATLMALCFFLILRSPTATPLLRRQESAFLFLSFATFLFMSDILPRFFNIALLPERALGFTALFLLSFIPLLFFILRDHTRMFLRLIPLGFFLTFIISIAAALYINNLKQYLITPAQLTSAQWIRTHLPKNHVIFSTDNHRLLTFYASSTFVDVSNPRFYSDKNVIEYHLEQYTPKNTSRFKAVREQLERISDTLADLTNTAGPIDDDFLLHLKKESEQLSHTSAVVEQELLVAKDRDAANLKYYIYYAAQSDKNPYAHRPYMSSDTETEPFIFDRYPERFRMIYSDRENDIYLWEVL